METSALKKFKNSYVKRSDAARKIQRAFRTWSKPNVITNNPIKSKRYALWNRSGKGHYNSYNLNTLKKLKLNPFSKRKKDPKNIIYRRGLHKKIPFKTPAFRSLTRKAPIIRTDSSIINSLVNMYGVTPASLNEIKQYITLQFRITNNNRTTRLANEIQRLIRLNTNNQNILNAIHQFRNFRHVHPSYLSNRELEGIFLSRYHVPYEKINRLIERLHLSGRPI